jgi:hypothetical protein
LRLPLFLVVLLSDPDEPENMVISEGIVHHLAFATVLDEPHHLEQAKVVRDRRQTEVEGVGEIADAKLI